MKKWTRRAFIGAGLLSGGALVIGVAIRPGNRASEVAGLIAKDGETMMNIWLKIAPDNTVTAIIPHAEMGQGVHTTLAMMLADEMDADWSKVKFEEAPAEKEYANYSIAKGFVAGNSNFPKFLDQTIEGIFLTAVKSMNFQITGGSASVRFTGQDAMRIAGAAAKSMLLQAATPGRCLWKSLPPKRAQSYMPVVAEVPPMESWHLLQPKSTLLPIPSSNQEKSST
ncbi:MAG: molybdopterin-dependent oxidoreductase [Algoriphagus sp.]|nr:molybdopterin-dependent oxidoreductase [Algoriphagus sp.]